MQTIKKTLSIIAIALFSLTSLLATNLPHTKSEGGYFDIYLKNNCGKTVEVTVRADGSSSVSKYNSSEKQKVAVKEGYQVYVDGKLYLTLKDSDSGKEINLCN
jgi:hypothetical protein